MTTLVDAAIELGLDTFTIASVAARVEVAESTVYGYVANRAELGTAAADAVLAGLDPDDGTSATAAGWMAYVDGVADRVADLARRHPGLRDYLLWGPYGPRTIAFFEALVAQVGERRPGLDGHTAFLLASRPIVQTLGYLGDPVLEPSIPWLRRALLRGLDELVDAGDLPASPSVPWRTKLDLSRR